MNAIPGLERDWAFLGPTSPSPLDAILSPPFLLAAGLSPPLVFVLETAFR